jgi:hypothetical protein
MSAKRSYEGQTESPETEYKFFNDLGSMGDTDKQDEEYNAKFIKFMKSIGHPVGVLVITE